jgi:hypothetical protein
MLPDKAFFTLLTFEANKAKLKVNGRKENALFLYHIYIYIYIYISKILPTIEKIIFKASGLKIHQRGHWLPGGLEAYNSMRAGRRNEGGLSVPTQASALLPAPSPTKRGAQRLPAEGFSDTEES